MGIIYAVEKIFDLIFLLLIVYVCLTWFPKIKWYNQPFSFLRKFSEIFFLPFRRLIPPMGGIDISPIFAFLALSVFRWALRSVLTVFFG